MINKYIKDLIPANSRIIIPDLGAFMIQNLPEGRKISFNDFLKFNDSILLNKIIQEERIDSISGKEMIKNYVKEIEAAFKRGEKYAIEGVGYLYKDDRGNIGFEQDDNAQNQPAAAETAKPEKSKKAKTAPKTEVQKADEPKPTTKPEAATNDDNTIEIASGIAPSDNIDEKESEVVSSASEVKSEQQPTTAQPDQQNTPIITNQIINNKNKMEVKTKNKALNSILIIVSVLIIIGVLIWAAINFKLIDRFRPAKPAIEEVVVDTTPAIDTTMIADTIVVDEPEPEIVSEPIDPNATHYYIIAGSFKVESYATRFQSDMMSRGYDAEIVINNSGFNCVSIKRFDTRSEAVSEWRHMAAENPNLWILVK